MEDRFYAAPRANLPNRDWHFGSRDLTTLLWTSASGRTCFDNSLLDFGHWNPSYGSAPIDILLPSAQLINLPAGASTPLDPPT